MGWLDDSEAAILKGTGAVRLEVNILGVTLHFAEGHKVLISGEVAQHVSLLIHREDQKVIETAREELRRHGQRLSGGEPDARGLQVYSVPPSGIADEVIAKLTGDDERGAVGGR
jgi:hypothetical protein